MDDRIHGFVWGIVTQVETGPSGRIKAKVPGLLEPETPYWIMPACWPGGGRPDGYGSQYPTPPVSTQIMIMFAYGIWNDEDSQAVYLTGYYGENANGTHAGPAFQTDVSAKADQARRVTLWEDENVIVGISREDNDSSVVIASKSSSPSRIELRTKVGEGGKSEEIIIEGRTGISLYSDGVIDIKGSVVQIQDRRVIRGPASGRGPTI